MSERSFPGSKSILVTFIVLVVATFAWSTSARLEREVWVRFDGQGLLVHDQFSTGIRYPQRLSVREPLVLQSASEFRQQVVLTSIEPGERGFPVGGTPTVFLESTVPGSIWYSIPISPSGWDVADAEVAIHTGPGWKVLATTGGGTGAGAWLDEWTPEHALGVLCLAAMIGFSFGWRCGLLAMAGLALAGASAIDPRFLYGASLVVCLWGLRRWMRPSWGAFSGGILLVGSIAAAGWMGVFSWNQILSIVDPIRHVEAVSESRNVTSCHHSKPFDLSAWSAARLQGKDWYASRRPVGGVIGGILPDGAGSEKDYRHLEAWIPDEDSSYHRTAHPSTGDPLWEVTSACREWREKRVDSPMDSAGNTATRFDNGEDDSLQTMPVDTPGVAAKQKMGLLVLPPAMTTIWRILNVVCLVGCFVACVYRHSGRRWKLEERGIRIAPAFLFALCVLGGAGRGEAQEDPVIGSVDRSFRFSREWTMVTKIEEVITSDSVVMIPLLPGEEPMDGLKIKNGAVVVSRKRFKNKGIGRSRDRDGFDSLYSGTWKGVAGPVWRNRRQIAVGWNSRLRADTALSIHADPTGNWEESWWIFSSERWHLRFQGMRLSGEWGAVSGRARLLRPRPGDSVRILFQETSKVPIIKTRLNQARLEFQDPFLSKASLHLRFHAAQADTVGIVLPEGAAEIVFSLAGESISTPRMRNGRLILPIIPGASESEIHWVAPPQTGWFRRSPRVTISVDGVNESIRIPDGERSWIPVLRGPGVGPSESGWMGFLAFGLSSLLLILRYRGLLICVDLVVVGFCASFFGPWFALAYGVVVFLHVRDASRQPRSRLSFGMLDEGGMTFFLLLPVLGLIGGIIGLLCLPPHQPNLEWYRDIAGSELMRPWMVVLPGWAWNTALSGAMVWSISVGARVVRRCIELDDKDPYRSIDSDS